MIGEAITAIGSYFSAKDTNKANEKMAREQMAFQERMSSTAHQREVADLKAAGLNPILSAGGDGSSTPPGARAEMMDAGGTAISSAMASKRLNAEIENIRATNDKIKADTQKSNSDTALNKTLEHQSNAQANLLNNSAKKVALDTSKSEATAPLFKTLGRFTDWSANSISNNIQSIKNLAAESNRKAALRKAKP
ncbi:DNA pilot protein [Blackfly microvirus SF02]|uniref:DNA pilot protein n=1 Tax=Blackfly microvirus SF02 TaxID=2576452 RepID=A0A4V1F5H9_9VIRU|nr:DNA pilot protein [Blackfly microvirus SF02]